MSTGTDKGSQRIQFQYEDPLIATEFNTHLHKILLTGIYDGGLLTRVSDSIVTVSEWVATITDGTYTIVARATTTYNVTSVTSTDRNIVLRWTWSETASWYVDVLAVSDGSVQTNDVVIGRAVYSGSVLTGFTYSNRTVPNTYSPLFLKVVPENPASMRVRVLPGRVNYGTANLIIIDQYTSTISAPSSNPRIDVVYVDSDGTVKIFTGVEAASPSAPNYQGKVVLAEINMYVGQTSIVASDITDARSLIAPSSVPAGTMDIWPASAASVPAGWLICDGSAVSRTTYAALYSAIGTTWGVGDGSTTFNLPDMQGFVPVGYKAGDGSFGTLAASVGAKTHTLQVSEVPSLQISIDVDLNGTTVSGANTLYSNQASGDTTKVYTTNGGGGSHNNIQPSKMVNYKIKT